jgi:1-acyl-sn-glycerol-3-phosphate acyltransferase
LPGDVREVVGMSAEPHARAGSSAAAADPASTEQWIPGERGARWGWHIAIFLAFGVWHTRVIGSELVPTSGPVLFAANHTGVIDGPILAGATPRPVHVLVKQEMFAGLLGRFLVAVGQISVDRASGRVALTTALGVLRRGGVVGIFPEGNRGRGDAASAHAGIAWLALNGAAPVVPVAVLGTRRSGESVGHVPGFRRRLVVEFGRPLLIARAPGTSGRVALTEANEVIRVALSGLVTAASSRAGLPLPVDRPDEVA